MNWPVRRLSVRNLGPAVSGAGWRRVGKASISQPTQPYHIYWYGTGTDPLVETDGGGDNPTEYVFFGGKRIARRTPTGEVNFYLADHLGSSRAVTDASGAILDGCDFLPTRKERWLSPHKLIVVFSKKDWRK